MNLERQTEDNPPMRPMQPNRYSFIDAYILEELRREYAASSSRERLRLLAKLKSHHIPLEIALLAVEDPDARVRAWFAKNGAPLQFGAREDLPNFHEIMSNIGYEALWEQLFLMVPVV